MYYNVNKTLSHNALINIVIGTRGFGKTYGLKYKAIKDFLEKGTEFVYLRRYESELNLVVDTLFNDIILNECFPGHEIKYSGGAYLVDDKLAGYAMPLSKAHQFKSASYPLVDLLIYDEFIIEGTGQIRYLNNEIDKFLNLLETIFRSRDGWKAFLLANSLSFINPYTVYWDLKLNDNKNYCKTPDKLVLCEIITADEEFINMKQKTNFGKLIKGTEFESFALHNKFYLDNDNFIDERSKNSIYYLTFTNYNNNYGVWHDKNKNLLFISKTYDKSCKIVYSTTNKDHSPNKMLLKRGQKGLFNSLFEYYRLGLLRFEDQKIKGMFMNILKEVI